MHKKVIGISPRFWSNETQEYIRVGVQYTNQLQREDIIPIIGNAIIIIPKIMASKLTILFFI